MPRHDCKPLPNFTAEQIAKFWSHVDKRGPDDCWPWTAGRSNGYGDFSTDGKHHYGAHRVALKLYSGVDCAPLFTCHSCDERYAIGDSSYRLCCNGAHLFPGTQQDNFYDMVRKGRHAYGDRNGTRLHPESVLRGEKNHNAKLTDAQVLEIRRLRGECGLQYRDIGKRFSITHRLARLIFLREVWKHIP